ncbi:class I SAM-dependent methyltransferase, partial [Candidatus Uhrbacteria bacterium]|nr:class I SAM-dependent methyltransferase [Candidatus Uhrbacteria bacterium]
MTPIKQLLATADIIVGGMRPHDIHVHNDRLYSRVLREGSLGFGEAYMDGWWDTPAVDELVTRIFNAHLERGVRKNWPLVLSALISRIVNLQAPRRAFEIGRRHYDIGNDLYRAMLDQRMTYSCGYWTDAHTLDEAQEAKLDLCCQKLGLAPGMRVLDIGSGWGSFATFAAKKYGVSVVGITVSKEQAMLAR